MNAYKEKQKTEKLNKALKAWGASRRQTGANFYQNTVNARQSFMALAGIGEHEAWRRLQVFECRA